MEPVVGKVVGKLGQGRWGQVHDFNPEEGEKRQVRGRLIAAVSLEVTDEQGQVQAVAYGREALSRLQELYYGETEKPAGEQLKQSAEKIKEEFAGLQMAAGVIIGEDLHLVSTTGSGIWVSAPNGKQGWLAKPGAAGDLTVKSFRGRGVAGEIVVLGTHSFWTVVSERLLIPAAAKTESNFTEAVEMIASEIQAGETADGGSGVILRFENMRFGMRKLEEEPDSTAPDIKPGSRVRERWVEVMKRLAGKVYVRKGDKEGQKRRVLFAGMGFMMMMLLFFAGGQIRNNKIQESGSKTARTIEKIQYDFDEAKAMAGINPVRSRELLAQVKQSLEDLGEVKNEERLEGIRSEWQGVWNEAAGIIRVKAEELLDLGLVRDGMTGNKLAKSGDELMVLDSLTGRVASVNTKTGAGKIAAGGDELTGGAGIATYPGKMAILAGGTIWEITGGETVSRVSGDETLGKAKDIKMWAGNIYLLVSNEGEVMIWRYQAAGDGFGAGSKWLSETAAEGIPGGLMMAIDGSIWVAGGTEVYKFTRGVREDFRLSGTDMIPGKIDGMYTDENTNNLYLWEKSGGRVVVVSKEGEYQKLYEAEMLKQAEDLVVDEAGKSGYFLAGGSVWKIDL